MKKFLLLFFVLLIVTINVSYAKTSKNINPLAVLVRDGKLNVNELKFRIKQQNIILKDSELGYELLMVSSAHCNFDIMKYLLAQGVSANKNEHAEKKAWGTISPLGFAVMSCKSIKPINLLVINGANVNSSAFPLYTAILFNKINISKYLIDHGANVNKCEKGNVCPIIMATAMYRDEILDYLLSHNVFIDIKYKNTTPLLETMYNHNYTASKKLIEGGANVNFSNIDGLTPLMQAVSQGNLEVVKLLLSKGANVNASHRRGFTALMFAAKQKNLEIIRLLLSKAATVNATDYAGLTPLMYACGCSGSLEIVKLLISKGADVNAASKNGMTALMIAATVSGDLEIAKFLVRKGADVNATGEVGATVLGGAKYFKHWEIANYLREHGAKD